MMRSNDYSFAKYQSQGNDFIVLDTEQLDASITRDQVKKMCDRRLGIGADGVILCNSSSLGYYNSDGSRPGFCGNGLRAAINYLVDKNKIPQSGEIEFEGSLYSYVCRDNCVQTIHPEPVAKMLEEGIYYIDTGVEHLVILDNLSSYSEERMKQLREEYLSKGIDANINIVSEQQCSVEVLTFERGVEAFTHSCGSGALAAAWVISLKNSSQQTVDVTTPFGKKLQVSFDPFALKGTTQKTFEGVFLNQSINLINEEGVNGNRCS